MFSKFAGPMTKGMVTAYALLGLTFIFCVIVAGW